MENGGSEDVGVAGGGQALGDGRCVVGVGNVGHQNNFGILFWEGVLEGLHCGINIERVRGEDVNNG